MSIPGTAIDRHRPRLAGELTLGTRYTVAALTGRHANVVPRHCHPIACDVASRQPLYDLLEAHEKLKALRRVA